MRFYIVLLTFSMCAWAALAAVSGVGNSRINHIGGHEPKVESIDDAGAAPAATDDFAGAPASAATDDFAGAPTPAAADAATDPSVATAAADPPLSDAVINGGQALGPPPGPKTAAEEKADSVLSCMEGCAGAIVCQNSCITTGYNVPVGPIPSVTASIPPPIAATVTAAVAPSAAPAAPTTAAGIPPKAQGSGAMSGFGGNSYEMSCAVLVVAVASFFACL
ncbi:hypothetical protein BG015_008067 [Linnemannia schmuckeri]|uniref:Uncharacterized protein n=1 Tax=Linnemannia schmuckeri TaxID=64567 RepID=A0A9P5S125_9FUNG|nr:hypothetical protein BG015_008067 [Linnemannia schmuckeri]